MADYLQKIGNFSVKALETFCTEGYFDMYNFGKEDIIINSASIQARRERSSLVKSNKRRYEFEFSPTNGFLASPDLLMTNCELKLSFDRSSAKHTLIQLADGELGGELEILDCYALTEYISSNSIQEHFSKIQSEPILYEYEETEVLIKSLPTDDTTIRIDNIRGGNTPKYLFAGVLPTKLLQGEWNDCCTRFQQNHVVEFNISLNGNSVNGYPLSVTENLPCYALSKFNSVTSRHHNVFAGALIDDTLFKYNFLWSHKFEAESTSSGWIGIDLKLARAWTEPMSLVIWIINPTAITLDQYFQIEKINL